MSNRIIESIAWKSAEKIIVQITRLVIEVIMARLLLPDDFGVFTLLLTFIAISNIVIEGGLGSALVQTNSYSEGDPSTVLIISESLAVLICLTFFLFGEKIATFYDIEGFGKYLMILSMSLFPAALNSVQNSVAMRAMEFRSIFISNSISIVISGALAIIVAKIGLGVWALIAQYIIQMVLCCVLMYFISGVRIKVGFSFKRARGLFSFGWKLMLANLLNRGYGEIYNLVIGKAFNTRTLGFYNRGKLFPAALENGLTSVITTVLFPVFSRLQTNPNELKENISKYLRVVLFIAAPVFCGIAATGYEIIEIILTDKWIEVVPIFQVLCIGYLFQPINNISLTAINGLGRSDIVLRLEILKRSIGLAILFVTSFFDIITVAIGLAASYLINVFLNCSQSYKLIDFSIGDLWKSVGPSLFCGVLMAGVVIASDSFISGGNVWGILALKVIIGIISYALLSALFNRSTIEFIYRKVRSIQFHRKG